MAEWQSSIRSYCDQGDDQWGIRPSTSRKGYLWVSSPDQQDIWFMPNSFPFQIYWILQFCSYFTWQRFSGNVYIYRCIYMSWLNEVSRNFIIYNDIQRLNLFKSCLVVSSVWWTFETGYNLNGGSSSSIGKDISILGYLVTSSFKLISN